MTRISEGEEDEEDNSSCGSTTTEFVPSVWDSTATPTKSLLRSADKPKVSENMMQNRWFVEATVKITIFQKALIFTSN